MKWSPHHNTSISAAKQLCSRLNSLEHSKSVLILIFTIEDYGVFRRSNGETFCVLKHSSCFAHFFARELLPKYFTMECQKQMKWSEKKRAMATAPNSLREIEASGISARFNRWWTISDFFAQLRWIECNRWKYFSIFHNLLIFGFIFRRFKLFSAPSLKAIGIIKHVPMSLQRERYFNDKSNYLRIGNVQWEM